MNKSDLTFNTRRFHRSMDQAFPFGPRYGNPVSGPYKRPLAARPWALVGLVAVSMILAGWAA
jgi:hypothetical protein